MIEICFVQDKNRPPVIVDVFSKNGKARFSILHVELLAAGRLKHGDKFFLEIGTFTGVVLADFIFV